MAGGDFEPGLKRVSRMEKTNQMSGRGKDAATPHLKLRGDSNPTKGGGINRATQPGGVRRG
jgi:hypothetical protein